MMSTYLLPWQASKNHLPHDPSLAGKSALVSKDLTARELGLREAGLPIDVRPL